MPSESLIRLMTDVDLAGIAELAQSVDPYAWNREQFRGCLLGAHYRNWVLEQAGSIIGFLIVIALEDEYELVNLAIAKSHQHQGFGKKLMAHLFQQSHEQKMASIWLEVRESNIPALQLYKKCGFIQTGIRRDYYPCKSGREHACVMQYRLAQESTTANQWQ